MFSVQETRFDRPTHDHYLVTRQIAQTNQFPEFITGQILTPRNSTSPQHQNLSTQVSQHNNIPTVEKHQEMKTLTQTNPLTV